MILHVSSFNQVSGEPEEAEKQCLKVAAFINQKFPGANVQILRNFDGQTGRMHMVDRYESVAAWEAVRDANAADPDFHALWADPEGLFDWWGSLEQHFFEIVE